MNEIEIKFRVEQFEFLADGLQRINAEFAGSDLQTDIYYDTPSDDLFTGGKGLRLRKIEGQDSELTFKGPIQPHAKLKIRPEFQTKVSDTDALEAILDNLGYVQKIILQKKRKTYHCGQCEILLDELPVIGRFVEIEGPCKSDVLQLAKKLNLPDKSITKHYVSLVLDQAQKQGITSKEFLL